MSIFGNHDIDEPSEEGCGICAVASPTVRITARSKPDAGAPPPLQDRKNHGALESHLGKRNRPMTDMELERGSDRGQTMRRRLLLVMIPLILILFGLFIAAVYSIGQATLREQLKIQSYYTGRSVLEPFDLLFTSAGEIADQLAVAVAASPSLRDDFLRTLIRATLDNNPEIFGSALAFIPTTTPLGSYAAYYHRTAMGIRYLSLVDPGYDYQRQSWFRDPLANGSAAGANPIGIAGAATS